MRMKHLIVTLIALLTLAPVALAAPQAISKQKGVTANIKNNPEAQSIAKKSLLKLKKAAYKTTFSYIYYSAETETSTTQSGELVLNNRLFKIVLNGIETKYDGLTQWVYMSDNNEVTITEPSRDELIENNPMMLLDHYIDLHRINMDIEQPKDTYSINFFPQNPKECDFFKINILINDVTFLPKQITISLRNGDRITMQWNKFDVAECDKAFFRFDDSQYPGVVVNDMR